LTFFNYLDVQALFTGIFKVDPRKRLTLRNIYQQRWVNLGYKTAPVDYLELGREKEPILSIDWIRMVNSASVCEAGCLLMEELEKRIPTKKLEEEIKAGGQPQDGTDEDDEIDIAAQFVSNMIIKDKKMSTIWWRRLFNMPKKNREIQMDLATEAINTPATPINSIGDNIAYVIDYLNGPLPQLDAQVPLEQLLQPPRGPVTPAHTSKGRFRAFTNQVANLFTPERGNYGLARAVEKSPKVTRHARARGIFKNPFK
jgi:hypothetical protein